MKINPFDKFRASKFKIIFVVVLSIVLIAVQTSNSNKPSTHVVTFKENGFYPKELRIKKGDTVIFKNESGKSFWPASNFHPLHLIYQEFDIKKPLETQKSWSFTFNRVGRWRYHDHLTPVFTGVIRVADRMGQDAIDTSICRKDGSSTKNDLLSKNQCWQQHIESVLEKDGLDKAFSAFVPIYENQPDFRPVCHDVMHILGEAAFRDFMTGNEFVVTEKSAYCGYGFYHGFNEALIFGGMDFAKSREFCDSINEKFVKGVNASGAISACYHGIGHGIFDLQDRATWGKEEIMVANSIKACEEVVGQDKQKRYLCFTGIFNALANAYGASNYQLTWRKEDPLWICNSLQDTEKHTCYPELTNAYLSMNNVTIEEALLYIGKIQHSTSAQYSMYAYISEFVKANIAFKTPQEFSGYCESVKPDLRAWCIKGIALTLFQWGNPTKEYDALSFCSLPTLLSTDKTICYEQILSLLETRYDKTKVAEICNSVDKEYRKYCEEQI